MEPNPIESSVRVFSRGATGVVTVVAELVAELVAGLVAGLTAELTGAVVLSSISRLFRYSGSAAILYR
jgi:hypothetical protein